jgi:SAM-dependent methyltransferase
MEVATHETDNDDEAPRAMDAAADWADLESRFYTFLGEHERIGQAAQQQIFAWYARQFAPGQRVLDVGSGPGDFLDLLSERGVQGFGVDPDPGMIAVARQRGHTIFPDDARHFLQTTRRRYDGVFMGNFVEHFPPQDLLVLFKGAHRVLRPGGQLILATPDPRSLHVHLQEFWRDATHVRLYDRDLLTFLVDSCGFHVRAVGSNDATAYNPADEWFGSAFAQRLAESAHRPVSPSTAATEDAGTHEPADVAGTADRVADASPDLAAIAREQQARIDDLEQRLNHLTNVVARAQHEAATARDVPERTAAASAISMYGRLADAGLPISRTAVKAGDAAGASYTAPMLTIPERRSAAALRRWRARPSDARQPAIPLPYHRPQTAEMGAPVPRLVIDLLMGVRDEVRGVAATSGDHARALSDLEARLADLGAIVDLTQQEALFIARAVRQRLIQSAEDTQRANRDIDATIETLKDALHNIYAARRTNADQIARQFDDLRDAVQAAEARIVAEEQTRDTVATLIYTQLAAFLAHLYPPREYYLIAARPAAPTHGER